MNMYEYEYGSIYQGTSILHFFHKRNQHGGGIRVFWSTECDGGIHSAQKFTNSLHQRPLILYKWGILAIFKFSLKLILHYANLHTTLRHVNSELVFMKKKILGGGPPLDPKNLFLDWFISESSSFHIWLANSSTILKFTTFGKFPLNWGAGATYII